MGILSKNLADQGFISEQNNIIQSNGKALIQILKREIENEFPGIVDVLKKEIPSLKEVRIFGSFITDRWDPSRSDIDFFVELGDENYAGDKDLQSVDTYSILESKQRQSLREKILSQIQSKYRFSFLIFSSNEVARVWNHNEHSKGPLGQNMKQGRLLYKASIATLADVKNESLSHNNGNLL